MNAIEASHLVKRFGTVTAVNDVSLTVREGEIFGFLGPNGAGKTTTMRLLTGVLTPDSGTVLHQRYRHPPPPARSQDADGRHPGEQHGLRRPVRRAEPAPEREDVRHAPGSSGRSGSMRLLSRMGLSEKRHLPVRTFSKGMKQRVSIACAIIHRPRVLFLDEPTSGLDVQSRRLVIDTIRRHERTGQHDLPHHAQYRGGKHALPDGLHHQQGEDRCTGQPRAAEEDVRYHAVGRGLL